MPAKTYKSVPSHTDWKKDRDAAGGKSGLCKKVNMGKLLDEYDKVKTKKKERMAALENLKVGLTHYTAEPAVKKIKDLHSTAMSLFKVVDTEILAMKMDRDIGLAVARTVGDGLQRLEKVGSMLKTKKFDEAKLEYERFYDGVGRGMGKILPSGEIRSYWEGVYKKEVSREDVTKEKDSVELAKMLVKGVKGYKEALNKVFDLAEKAGWELKL